MLKKKEFIPPNQKKYILREKDKYKQTLFLNKTFHLGKLSRKTWLSFLMNLHVCNGCNKFHVSVINSDQEEAIAAQLVLNHGAAVTKLNGKDYFRHEGTSSKFIYGMNFLFSSRIQRQTQVLEN